MRYREQEARAEPTNKRAVVLLLLRGWANMMRMHRLELTKDHAALTWDTSGGVLRIRNVLGAELRPSAPVPPPPRGSC